MAFGDRLRSGSVFPVTDRETPLIDKIRGAANEKFLGKSMASELASLVLTEDESEREEKAYEISEWFGAQLANELDVREEEISADTKAKVERFFLNTDLDDIIETEEPVDVSPEDDRRDGDTEGSEEADNDRNEDNEEEVNVSF